MDPQERLLQPGWLKAKDGVIEVVAEGEIPQDQLANDGRVILDARNGVVHPGLINAHAHAAWGLCRSFVPETAGRDESYARFELPITAALTNDDEYLGGLLAGLEMVLAGVTCYADTGSSRFSLTPLANAAEAVGIRAMISYFNADRAEGSPINASTDRCVQRLVEGFEAYPVSNDRVWACAGLLGGNRVSTELLTRAKDVADEFGGVLNVHKSSSPAEILTMDAGVESEGPSPLMQWNELGVLDQNVTLVHVNYCTRKEGDLLRRAGSTVVHCPTTSAMWALGGSSRGRFPELLEDGVPVALGTDATIFPNNWDVFRQMYLTVALHKEARLDTHAITGRQALRMATLHGARAVGKADKLGSLEVGKAADLVIHRKDLPEWIPGFDPISDLVFSAGSRSVDTVIANGEILVEAGRPTTIDLSEVQQEATRAAQRLLRRTGIPADHLMAQGHGASSSRPSGWDSVDDIPTARRE
jgi:5-methylthioadenosine/S-adenosylhomocysteine deaminase